MRLIRSGYRRYKERSRKDPYQRQYDAGVEGVQTGGMMRQDLDESDLTQLSRVNLQIVTRLKGRGYKNLWQIASADAEELADDGRVNIRVAERMIDDAKKLLTWDEDEGHGRLRQEIRHKVSRRDRKHGILSGMWNTPQDRA